MSTAYSQTDGASARRQAWSGGDFDGNRALLLLRGGLALVFGILALLAPGAALFALVLTFGAYLAIDGALTVLKALRAARRGRGWGWFMVEGLSSFVAAVLILFWPGPSLVILMILIGAWAIVSGAALLLASIRGRTAGRVWSALSGLASLLFGVLVLFAPLVGALVVTWWLAVYALIFGAMLVAAGFSQPQRDGGR